MPSDSAYLRCCQVHRDRKRNGVCQGLWGRDVGILFIGHKVSVWEDEKNFGEWLHNTVNNS